MIASAARKLTVASSTEPVVLASVMAHGAPNPTADPKIQQR
jgi:hypothetical protein